MVMRVEHARLSAVDPEGDGGMGGEMEEGGGGGSAVLPVAVGHGILSLLLLEELCDGQ